MLKVLIFIIYYVLFNMKSLTAFFLNAPSVSTLESLNGENAKNDTVVVMANAGSTINLTCDHLQLASFSMFESLATSEKAIYTTNLSSPSNLPSAMYIWQKLNKNNSYLEQSIAPPQILSWNGFPMVNDPNLGFYLNAERNLFEMQIMSTTSEYAGEYQCCIMRFISNYKGGNEEDNSSTKYAPIPIKSFLVSVVEPQNNSSFSFAEDIVNTFSELTNNNDSDRKSTLTMHPILIIDHANASIVFVKSGNSNSTLKK